MSKTCRASVPKEALISDGVCGQSAAHLTDTSSYARNFCVGESAFCLLFGVCVSTFTDPISVIMMIAPVVG